MQRLSSYLRVSTAAVLAVLSLGAVADASANRQPIRVAGLHADGWSATTSDAERNLHSRYPGISQAVCYGAIIVGDETDSSSVYGLSRYWDKLVCAGMTFDKHSYALIYDAKGKHAWVIYRLLDATINDLRG